jgi:hypothetical protein
MHKGGKNMLVREFTALATNDIMWIKVYDNEVAIDIFQGYIEDLPYYILNAEIGSWDIEDETICFNIN